MMLEVLQTIKLDENNEIFIGELPKEFAYTEDSFKELWDLHPEEYHIVKMLGKDVKTPRWQQAYGANYNYTGSKNNALTIAEELQGFHDWSKQNIHEKLNGLLLNWYDGNKKHYIGAHRDDTRDLIDNTPIVTISLGQERIFRMRPFGQKGFKDFLMPHGRVIVVPWKTNLNWTHEVPSFAKYQGKRISITLRCFKAENITSF